MKNWQVKNRSEKDLIDQLLKNRGIKNRDEFFRSEYQLADPFLMKGVKKAVARIKRAKSITIFGDYDADGVTAVAIMKSVLAEAKIWIPDRRQDGYGLNQKAIAKAESDLIITVDCGISDYSEVEFANRRGIDVIVTDHHQLPKKLPPAYAIINPQQKDCQYPFKSFSGAGVAFTLARALLQNNKDNKGQDKWLLDLAAIGTVADMVPLLEENRIIVKYGLLVLEKTRRLGLKQILPKKIDVRSLAFRIGPLLNAAGRMDHANTSYYLLSTQEAPEAERMAKKLEKTNAERQLATERVVQEIESQIEKDQKIFLISNDHWPVGILGLAAGRLLDRYHRPAVVISQGIASCRSIPGFDITQALEKNKDILIEFGGHPRAAGFRIENKNIKELKSRLERQAEKIKTADLTPILEIDAELKKEELNFALVNRLEQMEPFGVGNPQPVFLLKNLAISNLQCVGSRNTHLRFYAENFKAIAFGLAGYKPHLKNGDKLDLVFHLEEDDWNGYKNLILKIIDLKRSQPDNDPNQKSCYQ